MTYEHLAQRVLFEDNVVVTSGEKELKCRYLVVQLGKSERTEEFEVSGLTAEGDVTFTFPGHKASGQKLDWQDVTQVGVLTGEPAVLVRRDFRISGG